MDGGTQHLLALKVMRVSRPSIASAWEPFYSSSPAFSAHSTASILSLQGREPLPGHPKTLRDFSAATELLVLPASFGTIQLGETFASCLAVNNEAAVEISDVVLRVEIQTASTKLVLADFGAGEDKARLAPGGTMECVVSHEIKELGQHVLACTVSYRTPPGVRLPAPPPGQDPDIQVFRKFYKFAVTNPLSVRTKVHVPRAPSALLSASERAKVFLEVHVSNLTQEPIWFERLQLQPVEGWTVSDVNHALSSSPEPPSSESAEAGEEHEPESLFEGATALMQPQDVRQYVYVLAPASPPAAPRPLPAPGSVVPLGRLDISWRSNFGEPGRLLTSTLSRRIPMPPALAPALSGPPVPPKSLPAAPAPALPPHMQSARPMSPGPPSRPGSPFRVSLGGAPAPTPAPPAAAVAGVDIEFELLASTPARVRLEEPFSVECTLALASPRPRAVRLAFQRACGVAARPPPPPPEPFTPRLPSGLVTPTASAGTVTRPDALAAQLLVASPRATMGTGAGARLPPARAARFLGVRTLGASAIVLDAVQLELEPHEGAEGAVAPAPRAVGTVSVVLEYAPLRCGVQRIDGLRAFVLDEHGLGSDEDGAHGEWRVLGEWDALGEVWVGR